MCPAAYESLLVSEAPTYLCGTWLTTFTLCAHYASRACLRCCKKQAVAYREECIDEQMDEEMKLSDVENDSGAKFSTTKSRDDGSMQYRSVEASFESDDVSVHHSVSGGDDMEDWGYDNVDWGDDDSAFAESPLVDQVTQGVLQQSLNETPVRGTEEVAMNLHSVRSSPELIDLTNTPSDSRAIAKQCPDTSVIDLSESP